MKKAMLLPCFSGLLLISALSCSKNNKEENTTPPTGTIETTPPSVKADSVGNITLSSAVFYGKVTSHGGETLTDRGIYWGKTSTPTTNKTSAQAYRSGGEFQADLSRLDPNSTYYVRGYATNSKGTVYTNDVQFNTGGVPVAELTTDTIFATGATTAFVAGKIVDPKGVVLKEVGICYSKNANPTIADAKQTAASANEQSLFLRINNLTPATEYHIRSYATNFYGATSYGQDVKIATIATGNVTYTLEQNTFPTAEEQAAYARIKSAFDEAMFYYNNYTSITKTLRVTYNPGVATADATIAGNIRVGANAGYQKTGTALHEIAHAVGVGQHWFWSNNLIVGGVYQGYYANKMLRFMTGNPAESLKGDNLHFWPYGINGANEDTGAEMLFITNVLIMQGMKKDGLPSSN
ncbi:hypothetical protein [Paraflavitalea pollutisoli]|uniref:hypothetical protein n=1 Tax=Paraflavitalea pollutisoli TaxID=3034143 RepID=UPI0023EC90F5|nr:hypothetical protein [Paraflavitalea sp. H1-2-19X]